MSDKLPVVVKPFAEPYRNFVLDSWVNSMCFTTSQFFWVPKKLTMASCRRFVGRLLDVRPSLFRVLVNEEDESQIFAWNCGGVNGSPLHFLYVKEKFRREGLASMLIPGLNHEEIICTHFTKACEHIEHLHYRPSLFKTLIRSL